MKVLFLCRQNAGRSQMAQAFFERVAPGHTALSGGSSPAAAVHPIVIDAMREIGFDLSGRVPKKVDPDMLACRRCRRLDGMRRSRGLRLSRPEGRGLGDRRSQRQADRRGAPDPGSAPRAR